MAFITWGQYSSLHNLISEDEFDRAEALAEKDIRTVIGPIRWANITPETPYFDVLQDCIANLMDRNKEMEGTAAGKGVSSVSNDGYSESYAVTSEAELNEQKTAAIKTWLSGTGLVGAY